MSQIIEIPCGMVNCYLIAGKDQSVLVDTAGASSRQKVYDAVKGYKVTLIVLTHGHYDHIQNAAYLAGKLNAKVAMSEDDYDLIKRPSAHKTYGRTIIQKASCSLSALMYPLLKIDPFEPDFFLADGQNLAHFGIDGKIVELKGHTKGSIGVLLNGGKDFLAGDALMNFSKIAEPFLFEDYGMLRASMDILMNSGAANIYPGHGHCYMKK